MNCHLLILGIFCCGSLFAADGPKPGPGQIFPADNPWNLDIARAPVHQLSDRYVASIGADAPLHPDFGRGTNGIPFVVVKKTQKSVPVTFDYADESDAGPYPIPPDAPIEGGKDASGDRHILVLVPETKKLYELFAAVPQGDGSWKAGSGAIFDVSSNALRPEGWTSADAAGLPIFPGLARYEEVEAGAIKHALRFTVKRSQRAYVAPARHFASKDSDPNLPPMGLRFRLKAATDLSHLGKQAQVIAVALQRYGMFVADNGGNWFVSGAPNDKWDDDDLGTLKKLKGSDFEAIGAK